VPKTTDAADRRSGDGYSYGTTSVTRIVIEVRGLPGEELSIAEFCRRYGCSDGGARDALRQAHRAKNRGEGNGWASVGGAGPGRKPGRPLIEFREMRRDQIRLKPDTITAAYDAVGAKRLRWRKRTTADKASPSPRNGRDEVPRVGDLGEAKPRCRGDAMPINPNVIGAAAPISHAELPSPRDLKELGLVSLPPYQPIHGEECAGREPAHAFADPGDFDE
jgi:hypothetical protein